METLAVQPKVEQEQQRSFDPLASINMLRFDLEHYCQVLPETKARVCDEELSYLAEGIERASRTSFVLQRQGNELVYFDEGSWRPYSGMLQTGFEVAQQEAQKDFRRHFLVDWAQRDQDYGYKMRQLLPGQRLVWANQYPHHIAEKYGNDFMRSCGLNPDRQLGFIYQAYCRSDGYVVLESQTVDRSDADAFAAVNRTIEHSPETDIDDLLSVYDATLSQKYGGEFYAGRRAAEIGENVWKTIRAQTDLITYFLEGLEHLAESPLDSEELEYAAKRHVYGVWATFKKRIDGHVRRVAETTGYLAGGVPDHVLQATIALEVSQNFEEFARAGRVLVGCGGAIAMMLGEKNIMDADSKDVFSSIFGEPEDKYGSLNFNCPRGHRNTRPRGRLIEKCQVCKVSVRC